MKKYRVIGLVVILLSIAACSSFHTGYLDTDKEGNSYERVYWYHVHEPLCVGSCLQAAADRKAHPYDPATHGFKQ